MSTAAPTALAMRISLRMLPAPMRVATCDLNKIHTKDRPLVKLANNSGYQPADQDVVSDRRSVGLATPHPRQPGFRRRSLVRTGWSGGEQTTPPF